MLFRRRKNRWQNLRIYLRNFLAKRNFLNHRLIKAKLRRTLLGLKRALSQEKKGTKQMLVTYRKYTQGKATEAELIEANKQLLDVFRSLGLSVVVILPFAPVTLPAIVKLGEKLGIEVLPRSFRNQNDPDKLKEDKASKAPPLLSRRD